MKCLKCGWPLLNERLWRQLTPKQRAVSTFRRHEGRSLCQACYAVAKRNGCLENYPKRFELKQVRHGYDDGWPMGVRLSGTILFQNTPEERQRAVRYLAGVAHKRGCAEWFTQMCAILALDPSEGRIVNLKEDECSQL